MADTNRSPGPFAGCRDGYCQQAAGVVANGHVITVSMARFARQKLTDRVLGRGPAYLRPACPPQAGR